MCLCRFIFQKKQILKFKTSIVSLFKRTETNNSIYYTIKVSDASCRFQAVCMWPSKQWQLGVLLPVNAINGR